MLSVSFIRVCSFFLQLSFLMVLFHVASFSATTCDDATIVGQASGTISITAKKRCREEDMTNTSMSMEAPSCVRSFVQTQRPPVVASIDLNLRSLAQQQIHEEKYRQDVIAASIQAKNRTKVLRAKIKNAFESALPIIESAGIPDSARLIKNLEEAHATSSCEDVSDLVKRLAPSYQNLINSLNLDADDTSKTTIAKKSTCAQIAENYAHTIFSLPIHLRNDASRFFERAFHFMHLDAFVLLHCLSYIDKERWDPMLSLYRAGFSTHLDMPKGTIMKILGGLYWQSEDLIDLQQLLVPMAPTLAAYTKFLMPTYLLVALNAMTTAESRADAVRLMNIIMTRENLDAEALTDEHALKRIFLLLKFTELDPSEKDAALLCLVKMERTTYAEFKAINHYYSFAQSLEFSKRGQKRSPEMMADYGNYIRKISIILQDIILSMASKNPEARNWHQRVRHMLLQLDTLHLALPNPQNFDPRFYLWAKTYKSKPLSY